MAEPLTNHFGERVPRKIASQVAEVWPGFSGEQFLGDVLENYHGLGLMDRGRQIARTLRRHLPHSYPAALEILLRSVGDRPSRKEGDGGMATFLYLPHTQFVEEFGLDDFDVSMGALHVLTRRFTAEFSVRPFIERYETRSLALLMEWTRDPDPHVRRLVSEGTRPRLPWAARLRRFQEDPTPVLQLLETLRDDPEEFVRRSVANNLNDIGKDHPDVLIGTARRWMAGADRNRRALVRHALRTLVKQGDAAALEILGYGEAPAVAVRAARIVPAEVPEGGSVTIEFRLRSTSRHPQRLLVDLRVHYFKANGTSSPKVFKLKTLNLEAGDVNAFRKKLSLKDLTTRKHYPGRHRVEVLINGTVEPLGDFVLGAAPPV